MAAQKLTPLKVYNLLLDIENRLSSKVIADKYGVTIATVSHYRTKYFERRLIRKPVEWPYIGKVPQYLTKKITRQ